MNMRSRSGDTYKIDIYNLQSFDTPNIVDLLIIVQEK